MITFGEVMAGLSRVVPPSLAEEWDNSGPQTGSLGKKIRSVLVSIDLDAAVLKEAVRLKADLVVTHHPLIFKPLKSVLDDDPASSLLRELIRRDIAVYAMHTNLDRTFNTTLARAIGVKDNRPLEPAGVSAPLNRDPGTGSWGRLARPLSLEAFLSLVRKRLGCGFLRVAGPRPKKILTVACCGGSGGSLIGPKLKKLGIDCFLTADIRHHDGLKAAGLGLCVVDAGHFHTERVLLPEIVSVLSRVLPATVAVRTSKRATDPFIEPKSRKESP